MSDTGQTVRWSLEGEPARAGYLCPLVGRESPNTLIWNSIHRTGIETDLRKHFLIVQRVWYGLWIDSPLTREQCVLLHQLFADVAVAARRSRDNLQPFLAALREAVETGVAMAVKVSPPGHVDMGWITTFVHCPRCKAEGPFPRWQKSYPVEPVTCEICGHSYSPAATYAMEREYFAASIVCDACGASHRIKDFKAQEIEILESHHYYHSFCEELLWLRRVADFYQRHPEMQRQVKPRSAQRIEPSRSGVQEVPPPGVSLEQIEAPKPRLSVAAPLDWSEEDREALDYLRHNLFSLEPRWRFVTESVERLRPIADRTSVACPSCGEKLHVR
jgi:Zn ribbon nucleic-acid-binding protein